MCECVGVGVWVCGVSYTALSLECVYCVPSQSSLPSQAVCSGTSWGRVVSVSSVRCECVPVRPAWHTGACCVALFTPR